MELILVRHAEPEKAGLYIGRGSDPGLSPRGAQAAGEIAEKLAAERPVALYSSPLKRAMETIEPVAGILNMPVKKSGSFAEIDFGEWEGRDWKSIVHRNPDLYRKWLEDPAGTSPPGGETLKDLQNRVISALNMIPQGGDETRIIICCHAGTIRAVLGHVLGLKPGAFWNTRIDYAGLCRFSRDASGVMNLLQWNVSLV